MATAPVYATRRAVKEALDVRDTARMATQIDRSVQSASRSIDGLCNRRFYPAQQTLTWDYPDVVRNTGPLRLELNDHELISLTTLTAGGTPMVNPLLRPDWGPPFTYLEVNRSTDGAWRSGLTPQRAISVTGLFGFDLNEVPAGALSAGCDNVATTVLCTDSSVVGPGSLLRVGAERMVCTNSVMVTTGLTVAGGGLAASNAGVALTCSGAGVVADEVLQVDSERMLVTDVTGVVATVQRAYDGTVLAAHNAGAVINAPRGLVVERGSVGSTAAAHNTADPVLYHMFPGPVSNYCVSLALGELGVQRAGGRTITTRASSKEAPALMDLSAEADRVYTEYGRKARMRTV